MTAVTERISALPPQDDGWEVISEESPNVVIFDAVGDTWKGTYLRPHVIEPEDGESFTRYTFRGEDGELYDINAGYDLKESLEDIAPGTFVRITYVKDVPTKRKQNPMKSYRVEVKK